MDWRRVTKILLIVTAVIWIIYDLFPFADPARGDTISEVIMQWSLHVFSLPYAFGVLIGHFLWPREGHTPKPQVLFPMAAAVISLDVISYVSTGTIAAALHHLQTFPLVVFIIGVPIGHFFWPQQKSDKV